MTQHLIYLSIPGLRPRDIDDPSVTPTLHRWAGGGNVGRIAPSFPSVTSTVQASTWTGQPPARHGVIANGFYHHDRKEVEFWVGRNDCVTGSQIWDDVAAAGLTSAVWHAQNIKDAAADYIITPEPIHHDDGRMDLWCYAKPEGLYDKLLAELGHFPLQHYWGPMANIESTQWILKAARWLIAEHSPNLHYIYLPHLDYASQKFGPNSPQAVTALRELDAELADFDAFVKQSPIANDAVYLVVSEYAMTVVSGVVYPNRALHEAGLLETKSTDEGQCIDFARSQAFAMVDHQCAHIYAREDAIAQVEEVIRQLPGVAEVYSGSDRAKVAIDHPRSGDIVAISRDDHWFAYYWWLQDSEAPRFAHTVDIHRKPGYDPVELFFDPATKSIPLDATLVKGSHGVPPAADHHHGAVICSSPSPHRDPTCRDTDIRSLICNLMNIKTLSPM